MRKQIIAVIAIHVVLIAGAFTVNALTAAPQPVTTKPAPSEQTEAKQPKSEQPEENQAAERPQEAPQIVETYVEPSKPTKTPAAPQSTPAPAKTEAGGHIPFTNKPVTAGDPESYIDTVGQCPFYEMAGPKGCVPPPDIECNADWSVCKLKEEN